MNTQKEDHFFIKRTFELALKARGKTAPNPLVGAVIVRDGKIISEGFHKKSGHAHAELDAINNATESIEGATLYCNLEPCCHTNKKTPPCAQRIVKEKIKRVVICNLDPNPAVSGKGISILKKAGIDVVQEVLNEEGLKLNEIFFHHIIHKTPFIHLKIAQTLDGFTATNTGESKWITNDSSRKHVHETRDFYDGILIGANTARIDDPSLTVRIKGETRAIKRFILSRTGNISPNLKLFNDEFKKDTYLILPIGTITTITTNIIYVEANSNGEVDIKLLMKLLYKKYMLTSIFIEGGSCVHSLFLKEKLYNRLSFYIAPKILGHGKNTIQNIGITEMKNSIELKNIKTLQFNGDTLITGTK